MSILRTAYTSSSFGTAVLTRPLPPVPVTDKYPNGYDAMFSIAVRPIHNQDTMLTGFIFKYEITSNSLRTTGNGGYVTSSSGYDIRFESISGDKLPHRVESYNATTGHLIAYVKLPSWQVNAPIYFNIFFGNELITTNIETDLAGLYSEYLAAWNPITGAAYKSNNLSATSVGSTSIFGVEAGDYSGTSVMSATTPVTTSLSEITISTFTRPDAGMSTGSRGIVFWGSTFSIDDLIPTFFFRRSAGGYFSASPASAIWIWQLKIGSASARVETSTNSSSVSTDRMIHTTWKSGELPEVFINGTEDNYAWRGSVTASAGTTDGVLTGTLPLTTGSMYVGTDNRGGAEGEWDGKIGEVRIRSRKIAAYEAKAEYDNYNEPSYFYTTSVLNLPDDENPAPVSAPIISIVTDDAQPVTFSPSFYNPNLDAVSVTAVSTPSSGTADFTTNTVTYTPGAVGTNTFNFTLTDAPVVGSPKSVVVNVKVRVDSADTVPDAFAFTDVTSASRNTQYTSNTVTITGITQPSPVLVTNGSVSINGAAYTSSPTTITNGQTLSARVTSSPNYLTTINCVVSVGGVIDTYSVTTVADAAGPNPWAGDKSGLAWHSGTWGNSAANVQKLQALRTYTVGNTTQKRGLDILTTFLPRGGWKNWGTKGADTWKKSSLVAWLNDGNSTDAFSFAIQPFCSDANLGGTNKDNIYTDWPAKGNFSIEYWCSPNRPVGYQANLNDDDKRELHMDVWQHALDGHFDHIWEPKLRDFKTGINSYITGKRLIMRPWWETNIADGITGGALWGSTQNQRSSSPLGGMRTLADVNLVKSVYAYFNDILLDVFPGCVLHWNPLRNTIAASSIWPAPRPSYGDTMDLIDPLEWDIVGPDWYDRDRNGPSNPQDNKIPANGFTYAQRWDAIANYGSQAAPNGINHWVSWYRNVAKVANPNIKFGISEWHTWDLDTDIRRSAGDDDPLYVTNMKAIFDDLAAQGELAYECCYNAASQNNPAETTLWSMPGGGTVMPLSSMKYREEWALPGATVDWN